MRRIGIAVIAFAVSISNLAIADAATATKKPTPKATATATSKATVKSKSTTATSKKIVKRTLAVKPKAKPSKPKPRVTAKPKPVWPPKGFILQNGIYARVPSGAELIKQLTASSSLITECEQIACGSVYIASETPCNYWAITAVVNGPDPVDVSKSVIYGSMRVLTGPTKARTIYPIILRSKEPMIPHEALILSTLNLKRDAFYKAIAQGKSLTQIAGSQISAIAKAITKAELASIDDQYNANTIRLEQANALRDETSARVSVELTQYNLTVGSISMQCWTVDPEEPAPSNTYTPNNNHF